MDEKYEDIILPMMKINPKLVLGGSISLKMMGFMDFDYKVRRPDIDFSLISNLSLEEAELLKSFFVLDEGTSGSNVDKVIYENRETMLSPGEIFYLLDIVKFKKVDYFQGEWVSKSEKLGTDLNIDIFKNGFLNEIDIVRFNYKGTILNLTAPRVVLEAKMKYAFSFGGDKTSTKHLNDIYNIFQFSPTPVIQATKRNIYNKSLKLKIDDNNFELLKLRY